MMMTMISKFTAAWILPMLCLLVISGCGGGGGGSNNPADPKNVDHKPPTPAVGDPFAFKFERSLDVDPNSADGKKAVADAIADGDPAIPGLVRMLDYGKQSNIGVNATNALTQLGSSKAKTLQNPCAGLAINRTAPL